MTIFNIKTDKQVANKKPNLEKYDENAIHFHADRLQPILAKVVVGTYPGQRRRDGSDKRPGQNSEC